MYNSVSDSIY